MKHVFYNIFALGISVSLLSSGCGDDTDSSVTGSATTTSSSSTSGGGGGAGGGVEAPSLEQVLGELDADRDGTLSKYAAGDSGWPLALEGGHLFVTTNLYQSLVAGDHDGWSGTALTEGNGFRWALIEVPAGDHYKFVAGSDYQADPWSRSFDYDDNGQISLVAPSAAHLERFFGVSDAAMEPRTLQIWVPEGDVTHVLYVHDGQNLFDPAATAGGWKLQKDAPPGMMFVGINNTPARMDEYTHVVDQIYGDMLGGKGDAYANYIQGTIRPIVAAHYGEPPKVGVMGSSLGGLISLHIADHLPGEYDFAASLSGTLGWGSIGLMNETIIERYVAYGERQATVLYVDSGGGGACSDDDEDGIEDDGPGDDNYCETVQFQGALKDIGYVEGTHLHSWWEPDAMHNEAAWAARVYRPLTIFSSL